MDDKDVTVRVAQVAKSNECELIDFMHDIGAGTYSKRLSKSFNSNITSSTTQPQL